MDLGEVFLYLALVTSLSSFFSFSYGSFCGNLTLIRVGEKLIHLTTLLLLFSLFILTYYFIADDFNVLYVYLNSDVHLPVAYKLSAVWAGKEGSLLLWIFFISLLSSIYINVEKRNVEVASCLSIVYLLLFSLVFLIIVTSNPFLRMNFIPSNGIGLNPLLRTPEMIFHPPIMFLGYAAVTFPFASIVTSGKIKKNWIIFSWLSLTIGIFLGAWWAYKTLGWGGFWAWDPVENASLLPWVALTATIHLMRYKRESYFLTTAAFMFVLFAAFVTRSGVIKSVHAFSQSLQGNVYLLLIFIFLSISIYSYFKKSRSEYNLNNVSSVFLLLAVFFILAVLVGTASSIITSVGRFYYYTTALPIFGLITMLIGVCFTKRLKLPLILSSIVFLVFLLLKDVIIASSTFVFTFSLFSILRSFSRSKIKTFIKVAIHLGVIFLFLGSTSVWLYEKKYENVKIAEGNTVEVDGFRIYYDGALMGQDNEKFTILALMKLNNQDVILKQLVYKIERRDRVVNCVDIKSYPLYDCYFALKGFSNDFKTVTIDVYVVPLISFVWIGFYLLMIGGYFALTVNSHTSRDN